MYRKITIFLEYWKNSKHRKPLILQGARQVGKTYSVLEFGRTHYENTVYFNFDTNPKLKQTFDEDISPEYLVPILSHISSQTIVRETTLIVFDENTKGTHLCVTLKPSILRRQSSMTANTKTTWSVWGILFGMAIVLGIGVAFLAFTLTRDPQILAFLYDKITVPQSLHFITNFKWIFNLLVVCVTAIPAAAVLYVSERGFSRCVQPKEK